MAGWFSWKKREPEPVRDLAAATASLSRPAVQLTTSDEPSRSYFGGDPALPREMAWPERDGRRLGFLARVSLTDLQRTQRLEWLPSAGALLFFYDVERQPWGFDPADAGAWVVRLVPDLAEPRPPRAALADEERTATHPVRPRNVVGRAVLSLPSTDRAAVEALGLNDTETDAYLELRDARFGGRPQHLIGGFPSPVQGDEMELECQLASHGIDVGGPSGYADPRAAALQPGASEWRLLFQFDSDDELDVMWGDCGRLYVYVREADARAGDVSRIWMVLQCS